jgi:uncharacterized membrane protein
LFSKIINNMNRRLGPVGYGLEIAKNYSAAQAQVNAGNATPVQAYSQATGQTVSTIASTEAGALAGAEAGAAVGGPIGGAAGAVIGGIAGDQIANVKIPDDVKVLLPFLMLPDIISSTVTQVSTVIATDLFGKK